MLVNPQSSRKQIFTNPLDALAQRSYAEIWNFLIRANKFSTFTLSLNEKLLSRYEKYSKNRETAFTDKD